VTHRQQQVGQLALGQLVEDVALILAAFRAPEQAVFAGGGVGKLNGIEQDIRDILDQAGEYMDENRKTAIISAFSSRLGQLMVLAQVQRQEDDVAQDVDLDRAQDYGFKMEL